MGFWDALFDYFINPILSFVWENIKAFKDCPSEFETMKENEKMIQSYIDDINRQNHDLKTVEDFTKKLEGFMEEIKIIKEDYSRMGKISRLGVGKKLKEFNEKFKKEDIKKYLELAIQNKGEVIVPINDVAEFDLMKTNVVTIQKFISDVQTTNHGMETVYEFTNEMRKLKCEAEDLMANYSQTKAEDIMAENGRLPMGKKMKDINEKIETKKRMINEFLGLAIQKRGQVIVPINDVTEFDLMKKNVVTIQKFISDVQTTNHGMESLDEFKKEMRELIYVAEDIMADYSHPEAEDIMEENDRLAMPKKLKDFNDKIETMQGRIDNFLSIASQTKKNIVRRRPCDPVNDVDKIVGVGDAVSKINEWIMNEDKKIRHYNCIGVFGKGGSGKTTLAQMIKKDKDITNYFGLKIMFVIVSQLVEVKAIMKSMLGELKIHISDDDDESKMSTKIYDHLKESRYLLILDDVWNLDGGWWETIKNALPEGSENCILVTSRSRNIVRDMGVVENKIHEPKALEDEDGWNLFCKNMSKDDVSENPNLKGIGMEIVRKCGGLPLAIKVMGGVVSSCDISTIEWMGIRDSFMKYLSNNKNDIVMGSLVLSYDDLPEMLLQQCLLCFGVFPEDYLIEKDTMIRWWIGEGFVSSVESGEIYFEEIVNRSLVEVVIRDYNGKVLTCKLHDLVRELLIQKGKSEAFFEMGKDKISRRIVLNDDTSYNQLSVSNIKLRAIITLRNTSWQKDSFVNIFTDCKYLKVFDLWNGIPNPRHSDHSIIDCIRNLKNLKYLNMNGNILDRKDFISNLQNSHLVLCLSLPNLFHIPDSITEMKQLIWLDVGRCFNLEYFPKGLGNVSTLQVLKGFKPSSPYRYLKDYCKFEELRKLTQLVTLEIKFNYLCELFDSELDALSELDGLRHLTIRYSGDMSTSLIQKLDNLVLPEKLDELRLVDYFGEETPPWLNAEHLPRLGCLSLSEGRKLKRFHENFYGSGNEKKWGIVHLKLYRLPKLEGDWNVILERLPYLKTLHSRDHSSIRLENYPTAQEFDKDCVWRRR